MALIEKFLKSGVMVKGKLHPSTRGLLQGSPLSPLLSNVMLNELDQELQARRLKFVRYADYVLIFTRSARASERAMKSISRYLRDKLHLAFNKKKSRISRPMDVKFLGFGYYHDESTKKWLLIPHPESVEQF